MFYNNDVLGGQLIQSGVFRLYNGNTYITTFADAKMTEIDYNGNILFEYDLIDLNVKINRAKKYPGNYFQNNTGDVNNDNSIDIADVVLLVNSIINNNYIALGDMNFDQLNDIIDIIILINQILAS